MNYSMLFQGPTPPQLDGAISIGQLFAVGLIVGIITLVVIGGLLLISAIKNGSNS